MSGRLKLLLFIAYSLPYPFLAMWEDAAFGSLWCYGIMILFLVLLGRFTIRRTLYKVMFSGNALSLFLSLICTHFFQTEKWLWYFKPFSPLQMPIFLSVLIILGELFAIRCVKK